MRNPYKSLFCIIFSIALVSCGISSNTASPDATTPSSRSSQTASPDAAIPSSELTSEVDVIMVTNQNDNGPGSLRQAVLESNTGDKIIFDPKIFPQNDPAIILLKNSLPPITEGYQTIDASNAGVILDGSQVVGNWPAGITIVSSYNIIRGLHLKNFSGPGIILDNGSQYNIIGGDRNTGMGSLGEGNIITNNSIGIGIFGINTSYNIISGNNIGVDNNGTTARGYQGTGVYVIDGAHHNVIGPNNIIANNLEEGIQVYREISLGNTITKNSIYNNGIGIALNDGGNSNIIRPFITSFNINAGFIAGVACSDCVIEIFSDDDVSGKNFEGYVIADEEGGFIFQKETPFIGPYLTITATDREGNTSEFSKPTIGDERSIIMQKGNDRTMRIFLTKPSGELADNRLGDFPEMQNLTDSVHTLLDTGYKWHKIELLKDGKYNGRFWEIDWKSEEYTVDPETDKVISELTNNGVSLVACLGCLPDEEIIAEHGRFKTEDEITNYLSYVQQVVAHFKGRIQYYEIWNEPNIQTENWYIELPDYIALVRRTIPVILEEYPEAKIIVGSTTPPTLSDGDGGEYLNGVLQSDIMSIVDIISWHPMYGTSPEHEITKDYYYDYPKIVQQIKETASANGFNGQYYAAELSWKKFDHPADLIPHQPRHSEIVCAKYYARGIVIHLGMDVIAGIIDWGDNPTQRDVTTRLSTIMAGAEPVNIPIIIEGEAELYSSYSFSLSEEQKLVALWTNGIAVDDDLGVSSTIIIPDHSSWHATGIDVLHGIEQELLTYSTGNDLVIENLFIKDYPIFIWLSNK